MTRIPACFAENPSEASRDLLSVAPVGVDAHIDPLGTCGFAEVFHEIGGFCRDDVGIVPYEPYGSFLQKVVGADAACQGQIVYRLTGRIVYTFRIL